MPHPSSRISLRFDIVPFHAAMRAEQLPRSRGEDELATRIWGDNLESKFFLPGDRGKLIGKISFNISQS